MGAGHRKWLLLPILGPSAPGTSQQANWRPGGVFACKSQLWVPVLSGPSDAGRVPKT